MKKRASTSLARLSDILIVVIFGKLVAMFKSKLVSNLIGAEND